MFQILWVSCLCAKNSVLNPCSLISTQENSKDEDVPFACFHILVDYYPKLWRSLDFIILILIWLILHNEARRNGDKKWDVPDCLSQPSTTCVQNLSRLADQPDLTDMRFALRFTQLKFFMPIMFGENSKFDKYTLSQPNFFEMVSNQ